MKVNYIDENGKNVSKEIELNFNNISEADFQKAFRNCTTLEAGKFIFEGIQNFSLSEIQEMFKNCKNGGD